MAKEDIVKRIQRDLKYSSGKMDKLHRQIREDFKYSQGDQWEDKDINTLRAAGVKALTINKLKPIIKLLTGIERQSRSDPKAFPEGAEDVISADIASRLLKNVSKNTRLEVKESEVFKNGSTGGMCFLEPFVDYSFDLINGDLKFKKVSSQDIFLDPDFQEYDLSDAKFAIKLTRDLVKDDLLMLFPDDEAKIDKIEEGKIDFKSLGINEVSPEFPTNYPENGREEKFEEEREERLYDLIDYYYKKPQTRYFVTIQERGLIEMFDTEDEANEYAERTGGEVFDRLVPVVMHAQIVGNTEFFNDVVWSYPRWKGFPLFGYFAELITEDLSDYSLKIQGVVRGIRDLQEEFNKRRTQELRHLNSSANSGFDIEDGQLKPEEESKLKKWGSSPGIVIKRKKGTPPLVRVTPMPLSQGHAQLAAENSQDIKEASGVNPDLLANDSKSQSGRAILLKQRQGLVMIQEMLDNFSETKRLIGRFILSQLSELFTVETAMQALGDAFIADNFTTRVDEIVHRGLNKMENGEDPSQLEQSYILQYPEIDGQTPIVDPETGEPLTTVDTDTAIQTVNNVLTNTELNKYDVAIGEGPFSETTRMANFNDLKELAQQGVPIPPQSLIETSLLPEATKNKVLRQLAAQIQAAQAQPAEQQ